MTLIGDRIWQVTPCGSEMGSREELDMPSTFLPCNARCAKRGIAIIGRSSLRLSSVCNVDVSWSYKLG